MNSYITSSIKQFHYYKLLVDKTIQQLSDEELFGLQYASGQNNNNSIDVIMKHIIGNMKSRWTHFWEEDGEKSWRDRDDEFISSYNNRETLVLAWENAWKILFDLLESMKVNDLEKTIYIRNMGHTVVEAINRQMMHYAYHIGQIVMVGKIYRAEDWQSLSIPPDQSKRYNEGKFADEKSRKHFTDEFLDT